MSSGTVSTYISGTAEVTISNVTGHTSLGSSMEGEKFITILTLVDSTTQGTVRNVTSYTLLVLD